MIKIGQIGLNFGLHGHIPAFLNDRRFQLVSVCSKNIQNAEEASKKLNIPHYTDNPRELFSQVDAVSFALPPAQQAVWLPEALERGLHIFCEKPLGYIPELNNYTSPDQALMVNLEFLEIDVWQKLRNQIQQGALGEILHCEVIWNVETYAVSNKIKSWKTDISVNGGTLNNFGSHVLYYLEELFGPIHSISAMSMPEIPLTDETIYLYTKFISGQVGSIAISTNSYRGSGHSLEVTGTNGSAILKNIQQSTVSDFELEVKLKNGETQAYKSEWVKKNNEDDRILAVTKLVNKFGDWIHTKEVQSPNIDSAIRVEKLLNSSVQSMREKKIIII